VPSSCETDQSCIYSGLNDTIQACQVAEGCRAKNDAADHRPSRRRTSSSEISSPGSKRARSRLAAVSGSMNFLLTQLGQKCDCQLHFRIRESIYERLKSAPVSGHFSNCTLVTVRQSASGAQEVRPGHRMLDSIFLMLESFHEHFGSTKGVRVYRAPGRVNLIGEHTDYNLGFVLPVALDLATLVATGPSTDGMLRIFSEQRGEMRQWKVEEIAGLKPARGMVGLPHRRGAGADSCRLQPQNRRIC